MHSAALKFTVLPHVHTVPTQRQRESGMDDVVALGVDFPSDPTLTSPRFLAGHPRRDGPDSLERRASALSSSSVGSWIDLRLEEERGWVCPGEVIQVRAIVPGWIRKRTGWSRKDRVETLARWSAVDGKEESGEEKLKTKEEEDVEEEEEDEWELEFPVEVNLGKQWKDGDGVELVVTIAAVDENLDIEVIRQPSESVLRSFTAKEYFAPKSATKITASRRFLIIRPLCVLEATSVNYDGHTLFKISVANKHPEGRTIEILGCEFQLPLELVQAGYSLKNLSAFPQRFEDGDIGNLAISFCQNSNPHCLSTLFKSEPVSLIYTLSWRAPGFSGPIQTNGCLQWIPDSQEDILLALTCNPFLHFLFCPSDWYST